MRILGGNLVEFRRGLPFQDREMRVTIEYPAGLLSKARKLSFVRRGEFGQVMQDVQREYKGATISITPVKVL